MSDASEFDDQQTGETGSDELLSDDNLHLPENANILVRLHAVRAWLARRRDEASLAVGEAALALQEAFQPRQDEARPRRARRMQESDLSGRVAATELKLQEAQVSLAAFEEAQEWLEECIAHTQGERVLVEYYLMIEQALLDAGYTPQEESTRSRSPWFDALAEVLHRVEHVGIPEEP